ncbi:glucosaminidase domain-containing protein [Psychrosphaera sp. F3M07]|uniref:glucosaminidase domain-containing protein n=1 Tax=Psychrosphaera sp. F3M07 TaxID=2841560 RepID=UPI001C09301C|nr:glucosaminidase domain-containing protein [Psychrosphaera sp. F3M07]MBU2918650.1 glucosaminidase domain-containing protein [Psychrosphaera sp. F3M07]
MTLKIVTKIILAAIVVYAAIYPMLNLPTSSITTTEKNNHLPNIVKISPLPDFSTYVDVKEKKVAFFSYLTPYVEQINREISLQRDFINRLDKFPQFTKDAEKLVKIAKKFKVDMEQDFPELKRQLLLRVDTLPIELVLMQAANESAWGTSRFALTANNLFGQWCFRKGCGVVPSGRPEGKTYEVRKFKHPIDSVRGYYHNLNTGHAYDLLRDLRANLRKENKQLDPNVIADGLLSYSTRREAYIAELKQMIRINRKYIKGN